MNPLYVFLRKSARGFVCLRENGWNYTWYHGLEKIGRRLYLYSKRMLPYHEVRRHKTDLCDFAAVRHVVRAMPCSGRRIALFAMYAPSGKVPEATWIYLRGLREVSDNIIACSDCFICPEDVTRLKRHVSCAILERHGGYDFGSYARAYEMAEAQGYLADCKTLILANDSCVGPLFPFSEMFRAMANRRCDFWGQTSFSFHSRVHVQSYFMVFNRCIVESGALGAFLTSVKTGLSRKDIISSCEIALTESLVARGFSWGSFVPYRAMLQNPTTHPVRLMAEYSCPLVKIKALVGESFDPLDVAIDTLKRINPEVFNAFNAIARDWEAVPLEEDLVAPS